MRATGMLTMTQNARALAEAATTQAREQAQAAREQAQAAREQAQAAREQAQDARNDARDAAREAARNGDGGGDRTVTIISPDGKTVTLSNPTADALAQLGFPSVEQRGPDPGPYIVGSISIVSTAIVLLVALTQRYRVKMRGAGQTSIPNDLAPRLARMEAGIESVAVEVERISEGQRFTTRLLSDRERVEVPRG